MQIQLIAFNLGLKWSCLAFCVFLEEEEEEEGETRMTMTMISGGGKYRASLPPLRDRVGGKEGAPLGDNDDHDNTNAAAYACRAEMTRQHPLGGGGGGGAG